MTEPKLCRCGCGQPTPIADRTRASRGMIQGQAMEYLPWHSTRFLSKTTPQEAALCQCGCGQPVPLAKKSRKNRGWTIGQPLKYLPGHYQAARKRNANGGLAHKKAPVLPPRQLRCTDCGAPYEEDLRTAVFQPRCHACVDKEVEERHRKHKTFFCAWCGETAMFHSGTILRRPLAACMEHYEKLHMAMIAGNRSVMQPQTATLQAAVAADGGV